MRGRWKFKKPLPGIRGAREFRSPLVWYEPEDYARLQDIMNDAQVMPWDYQIWRKMTEDHERSDKRSGLLVVRVKIHADEFFAWCEARAVSPDCEALKNFERYRIKTALGPTA